MKKLFVSSLACFVIIVTASVSFAQDMGIITGNKRGTYYQFGLNLAQLVRSRNIKLNVLHSAGSVQNVYAVYKAPGVQLGIVQSDVLAFITKIQTDAALIKVASKTRMVFPLYNEEVHLVGQQGILDFDDLADRVVAIGEEGSGTYLTARILFEVSEVKPRAVGDRYGRKQMALIGVALAIPAALISGFAPNTGVLFFGRLFGGFTAGMAYPTTLALIAALWGPGAARTKAIAMWAALGGAISVSGPLLAGILLKYTTWPWVFLILIPLAVAALFLALRNIPAHVNETSEKVDHLGGILSVILVGAFVLSLNFLPIDEYRTAALGLLLLAVIVGILFVLRQRRAENPLYDLKIAARPPFFVAAIAGIIIFGSLMGAMFIGQQYIQDVLGLGTIQSAIPALFAGACMVVVAPGSAKLVETIGSRATMLRGYIFILFAFLIMVLFWKEGTPPSVRA